MAARFAGSTEKEEITIALVGSPNVGKSTVFNALTGMNQHTGNWPGKTVEVARGRYTYKGKRYGLVDLPGTYSLLSQSEDERIAVDYLLSGQVDCILVVGDATSLERNLKLLLQVFQLSDQVVFCVNLADEAERCGTVIDYALLEKLLGVPVIPAAASRGRGLDRLQETIRNLTDGFLPTHPRAVFSREEAVFSVLNQKRSDEVSMVLSKRAAELAAAVITKKGEPHSLRMDRFLLGKWSGRLILLLLLLSIFWFTIYGANYPTQILERLFAHMETYLAAWTGAWPGWLSGILVDGIYSTVTNVVAVMLPPMAIFFPFFTLLEDWGYLPRAAFLMDRCFQRCGGCGKQALTMAMGFGCNAVGITGCRIISSPKERLIAIVTNGLVPCNGKFASLIAVITVVFSSSMVVSATVLTGLVLLSVLATFLASKILSQTLFRGHESVFMLEMPPYRKPQILRVLLRSLLDRTLFVLGRAVAVAAPAGAVIWGFQQIHIHGEPLMAMAARFLDPMGILLGMNGAVLLAFLLSFPANELFLPMLLLLQNAGMPAPGELSLGSGICILVFMLFHWPCSTACLTIHRETGSWKWTLASILLPTVIGAFLCGLLNCIFL